MRQRTNSCFVLLTAFAAIAWTGAERDAAWVDRRIDQWQPTAHEKRWEGIGWVSGLSDAIRLGRENKRPVFVFTHDGRLNVGRC